MPSERAIVETLNRKELLDLVSYFDLDVADRRVRDHLVDAIAMAPGLSLSEVLEQLPLATLKSVCQKHGVQAQGRGKAAYVAGIAAMVAPKSRATSRIKAVAAEAPVAKKGKAVVKAASKAKAKVAKKAIAAKAKSPVRAKSSPRSLPKPAAKAKSKAAPKTPSKAASKTKAAPKSKAATKVAPKAKAAPKSKAAAKLKVAPKLEVAPAPKVAKPAKGPLKSKAPSKIAAAPKPAAPPKAPVTPKAKKSKAKKAAEGARASAQKPIIRAAKDRVVELSTAAPEAPSVAPEAAAPPPSNVIALPYVNTPAAVAAAEAAAVHLRSTVDPGMWSQPTTRTQKCASCSHTLELRKCTAQKCNNMLVASPTRKICAECMFERNTLSMDDFNVRMEEEANCPHCGKLWQKSS